MTCLGSQPSRVFPALATPAPGRVVRAYRSVPVTAGVA